MVGGEPRAFFIRFWANHDAVRLASGIRAGASGVTISQLNRKSCFGVGTVNSTLRQWAQG